MQLANYLLPKQCGKINTCHGGISSLKIVYHFSEKSWELGAASTKLLRRRGVYCNRDAQMLMIFPIAIVKYISGLNLIIVS
jgi:hypothetical protein